MRLVLKRPVRMPWQHWLVDKVFRSDTAANIDATPPVNDRRWQHARTCIAAAAAAAASATVRARCVTVADSLHGARHSSAECCSRWVSHRSVAGQSTFVQLEQLSLFSADRGNGSANTFCIVLTNSIKSRRRCRNYICLIFSTFRNEMHKMKQTYAFTGKCRFFNETNKIIIIDSLNV